MKCRKVTKIPNPEKVKQFLSILASIEILKEGNKCLVNPKKDGSNVSGVAELLR